MMKSAPTMFEQDCTNTYSDQVTKRIDEMPKPNNINSTSRFPEIVRKNKPLNKHTPILRPSSVKHLAGKKSRFTLFSDMSLFGLSDNEESSTSIGSITPDMRPRQGVGAPPPGLEGVLESPPNGDNKRGGSNVSNAHQLPSPSTDEDSAFMEALDDAELDVLMRQVTSLDIMLTPSFDEMMITTPSPKHSNNDSANWAALVQNGESSSPKIENWTELYHKHVRQGRVPLPQDFHIRSGRACMMADSEPWAKICDRQTGIIVGDQTDITSGNVVKSVPWEASKHLDINPDLANFKLNPEAAEFRMVVPETKVTPTTGTTADREPKLGAIGRFEFGPALVTAALSGDLDEDTSKDASKPKCSPRFQFAKQPVGAPPKPVASPRFTFTDGPKPVASPRFSFLKPMPVPVSARFLRPKDERSADDAPKLENPTEE